MGERHKGQRERGDTTDSPRGSRWMQTFAKLPMRRPRASAKSGQSAPGASANAPVSSMRRHARGQRRDVAAEARASQARGRLGPQGGGTGNGVVSSRAMTEAAAATPPETPRVRRPIFTLVALSALVSGVFLAFMLAATQGMFVPQVVDLYLVCQYARAFVEGHPFRYNPGE